MTPRPAESGGNEFELFLSCSRLGIAPPWEQAMRLAHRHGFQSIDPPPAQDLLELDGPRLGQVRAELERYELAFGPALLPVDFRGADPDFRDDLGRLPALAGALRSLGVAAATTYVVPSSESLTYRENFARHTVRLRECARILDDHGLRLGIEYVGPKTAWTQGRHPFIHTLAEALELLDAIDADNGGVYLDSFHWYTAGETPADVESLRAEQVVGVDLNDAVAGVDVDDQGDHRRELPGASGVIPLDRFIGALRRIDYHGPVAVEPFTASVRALPDDMVVAATAATLRNALGVPASAGGHGGRLDAPADRSRP